jgi:hypothetical protein
MVIGAREKGSDKNIARVFIRMHEIRAQNISLIPFVVWNLRASIDTTYRTF